MMQNQEQNGVGDSWLTGYVAEACKSLSNMERVHCFWRCTTMSESDFRKFICELLESDGKLNIYDDVTPELLKRIFSGFVDRAMKINGVDTQLKRAEIEAFNSFRNVCKQVAEKNIRDFFSRSDVEETVDEFLRNLVRFFRDEELAIYLLLNFVRAVARNELKQTPSEPVDFRSGIEKRIWKNAAGKYFPKECVLK